MFALPTAVDDDEIRTGNSMILTLWAILAETSGGDDTVIADLMPPCWRNPQAMDPHPAS
jgi:hypothetical protein